VEIKNELIDELKGYQKPEDIIGENSLLKQSTKALLKRAMSAELTTTWVTKSTIRLAMAAVIPHIQNT